MKNRKKQVAIIVAHADDEILWAGGTLLSQPGWKCFILCLCRKNDPNRVEKFHKTLNILKSEGAIADLDDGPEQRPLDKQQLINTIILLLPAINYDLIITHSPLGEYTRNLRHEEVGKTVIELWNNNKILAKEMRIFAYSDNNRMQFPEAIKSADIYYPLPPKLWQLKYALMTQTYGFNPNTWEAESTPKAEAFWKFMSKPAAKQWLKSHLTGTANKGILIW